MRTPDRPAEDRVIYTIGHSTLSIEIFCSLLESFSVSLVVDVRTIPRSRHNPQYNSYALQESLAAHHIAYRHMKDLGGLRKPLPGSVNRAWRNSSFRGFADYMETPGFAQGIEDLISLANRSTTAAMCAESLPWRCHRSLIADALSVHGWRIVHIMSNGASRPHTMTPFAKVDGGRVTYPGP